jgi:biopolymer transport protein ExbD
MSAARHTRRRQRRLMKGGRAVPLNIVSMIDIFAILVFFLLINYWQVDVAVTQVKDVQLPESAALQEPQDAVVVTITASDILVQGHAVLPVTQALQGEDVPLPPVQAALEQAAAKIPAAPAGAPAAGRRVIIMGDRQIPYHLLKRVMLSCAQARFADISLAVVEKKSAVAVHAP